MSISPSLSGLSVPILHKNINEVLWQETQSKLTDNNSSCEHACSIGDWEFKVTKEENQERLNRDIYHKGKLVQRYVCLD